MAEATSTGDKRAQHVAGLGFWINVFFSTMLLGLARWADSSSILVLGLFTLIGIPIWAVLYLIYRQVRNVRAEQLETAELKRAQEAGDSTAIFEYDSEDFLIEQNRLRWMVRWLLPGTTVLIALGILVASLVDWGWTIGTAFQPPGEGGIARTTNPMFFMSFVVGIGFLCYFGALWTRELSRLNDWRLFHGAATLMSGNAMGCLGLAIALMASGSIEWAEPLFCVVGRVAIVLIGLELTVNLVLDFYRPRQPGFVSRPSFDSRLLGLVADPGGIAKSIAEAVNYQFGFEVSSTWFYQLLQRWIVPLMATTALLIILLSSVIIVDADEQVIVERLGVVRSEQPLSAGIYFKWPYPFETAQRANAHSIGEIVIGEAKSDEKNDDKPVIWTEEHEYVPELMLLVAAPKSGSPDAGDTTATSLAQLDLAGGTEQSVPVSLLMVSVPIEYRIKNVKHFLYNYADPIGLLEGVAYRFLTDYASSVDADELLGPGREAFNKRLHELIQRRLDQLEVGIELAFVGVRGAHPPAKDSVAAAFQATISAMMEKQAMITAAEGEARRILTTVAGSEDRAVNLDEAILERDRLQSDPDADPEEVAAIEREIDGMLEGDPVAGVEPLSGTAAILIADARADAFQKKAEAAAKVRAFATEAVAFETAPELYTQRRILDIYRGLNKVRKYVVLGDPRNLIVIYDTQEEGGLDRVLSTKE